MAMLQRVAAKFGPLPDAEFVVDTTDGYWRVDAPLFIIAKVPRSVAVRGRCWAIGEIHSENWWLWGRGMAWNQAGAYWCHK